MNKRTAFYMVGGIALPTIAMNLSYWYFSRDPLFLYLAMAALGTWIATLLWLP